VGGSKRRNAVAFVLNNKGYVCGGVDNGVYEEDFWAYDPQEDIWTKLNAIADVTDEDFDDEYTGIVGTGKTAFTVNGLAYIAIGGLGSVGNSVWEYDPETDLWERKTSFEGTSRVDGVSFTINNKGYVTTGRSSSSYFDDIWLFEPFEEYDEDD
jgi:N-acetylneuraminic acid mutarotase